MGLLLVAVLTVMLTSGAAIIVLHLVHPGLELEFQEIAVTALLAGVMILPLLYIRLYLPLYRASQEGKEAEEALRLSDERLSTIVEGSDQALWEWEIKTDSIHFLYGLPRSFGFSRDVKRFNPNDILARIHPEDRQSAIDSIESYLAQGGQGFELEMRLRALNGNWIWILARGRASRRDENGKVLRVTGTIFDISSRVRLEERIRDSEKKFSALFHNSNDGILIIDRDWNIYEANSKFLELTGYTRTELVNMQVPDLHPAHSMGEAIRALEIILQRGWVNFEIYYLTKTGDLFLADVSASMVDVGGKQRIQSVIRDITDRRRIERELDSLFNMSSDLLCIFGAKGELQRINNAWSSVLGFDLVDIIGRDMLSLVHPDDVETTMAFLSQLNHGQDGVSFENRFICKNGTVKWISWVATSMVQEQVSYGIGRDITDRKQFEQTIIESEQILRQFVEHTPAAVAMFDDKLNVLQISRRWVRDYALPREKVAGMGFSHVFPGTDGRWLRIHERCLKGKVEKADEEATVMPDGTTEYLRWEVRPWRRVDGSIGGTIMISEVVTPSVRARQAIRENEARMRGILEASVDAMVTAGATGLIESFNPAAVLMFGYTEAEALGCPVSLLISPKYHDVLNPVFDDSVQSNGEGFEGGFGILGETVEMDAMRSDGYEFPADISISRVKLEKGYIFSLNIRDTTERRKVERMKNEFISTVNHELRTPLTSIHASLGLVMGGAAGEISEQANKLISMAFRNSKQLNNLINDILDIEKIEAGALEYHLLPVDLGAVVAESVESSQSFAKVSNVSIRIVDNEPGIVVQGERGRLGQVVMNLLSNAIKFTRDGTEVVVGISVENTMAKLCVKDHGPGIPKDFEDRIFQKFAQADSSDSRRKGGTGLGLSIAKAIVEKHGGKIGFESTAGNGTTFCVNIPIFREN